jgi:hypothetical protein
VTNHSYTIIVSGDGNIDNVSSSSCIAAKFAAESENTTLFKGNREAAGVREHVTRKLETVAINYSVMKRDCGCWTQDAPASSILQWVVVNNTTCGRNSKSSRNLKHAPCTHCALSPRLSHRRQQKKKHISVSDQEFLWKRACWSPVERSRAYDNESLAVHSARLISRL